MMQLDATLLAQMINFLLLFAILNIILFRPIHQAIEARRRFFSEGQKRITTSLAKIQEMQRKYQRMIDSARRKAQAMVDATIQEAEKLRQQEVRQVLEENRRQLEEVMDRLRQEKEATMAQLGKDIGMLAERIADKVMRTDDPRLPPPLEPVGGRG